ncbi:hypothetical protein QVD99_005855 [Batrachochytrium dendrobatidis]|nr:hypothetical protein O5D80_006044 [Batrachochytrium dendrobatidis]KAK5667240.1 hypothetical protein QVD99_005855 [Batrachochytrium dendrobatidis]
MMHQNSKYTNGTELKPQTAVIPTSPVEQLDIVLSLIPHSIPLLPSDPLVSTDPLTIPDTEKQPVLSVQTLHTTTKHQSKFSQHQPILTQLCTSQTQFMANVQTFESTCCGRDRDWLDIDNIQSSQQQQLPSPSPLSSKLQSILYHLECATPMDPQKQILDQHCQLKKYGNGLGLQSAKSLPTVVTPMTALVPITPLEQVASHLSDNPSPKLVSDPSLLTDLQPPQNSLRLGCDCESTRELHCRHAQPQPKQHKEKMKSVSESGKSTPDSGLENPQRAKRRRRLSNHITLAKTAVGLREIAKKIGMAYMRWESPPRTVMIVTKLHDPELVQLTYNAAQWLIATGITVFVQQELFDQSLEETKSSEPTFKYDLTNLRFWTQEFCTSSQSNSIDFIVTLGGDGTVLYAAWLFQQNVPPIIPFNLGSLGFLTVFPHSSLKTAIQRVLDNNEAGMRMNFRMRFACTIIRKPRADGSQMPDNGCVYHILNDMVVDRGPSPYLSQLELYGDENHLTTVQADGLVIATPTGSTAYSLSAGGSVVHPDVSAILVTPICPHTLSFRPMILPDTMDVKIVVPKDSRATAWVSFDGRHRVQLQPGDSIRVCASQYAVPTVCWSDQSIDWFHGLEECLAWNKRDRQKKLSFT